MKTFYEHYFPVILILFSLSVTVSAQMPKSWEEPLPSGALQDDYEPGVDSKRQEGVPVGKVFNIPLNNSNIFPGTKRNISVYVPAQYQAVKPACVYVALDGLGFNAPIVFDNLIHKGEIPVIIGIGISSGNVPVAEGQENPRFNRSYEFDSLNDDLCRLLLEEVFPLVESHKTPDGLEIKLSRDPNDRCTGGASTGGIGAFTLAWERPDQFRRVFSAIGTFVCMRGGDRYPVLVRKTEPKPIRVFLQDGHLDQWGGGPEVGDWWIGNVALNRALEFSGYDVNHAWGTGLHSGKHATAIFPDAMRWLWRDYPEPVKATPEKTLNVFAKQILKPKEDWTIFSKELRDPHYLAVNQQGEVFAHDVETKMIYRFDGEGKAVAVIPQTGSGGAIAFDANGTLLAADTATETIFVANINEPTPQWTKFVDGINASQISPLPNGDIYVADAQRGIVWLVKADGSKTMVADNLVAPGGVALMPDGKWLAAVESRTHWGTSFQIKPNGELEYRQRYYWFHVPDEAEDLGNGNCRFDQDGRFYVATRMGVTVLDRNGRSRLILPLPNTDGNPEAISLDFGTSEFDTIYFISVKTIFKRKLNIKGVPSWKKFDKLPNWGAG
ncbi:MAG: SMP-30/gluconolactonase/LRE family protein [Planctomycetaceae bacterium]|jgi:sugar lactone lactonase YvrE|nr:SMP-30/gluconolactonase/LRE family protein [Planctomycetaceae bacterium]